MLCVCVCSYWSLLVIAIVNVIVIVSDIPDILIVVILTVLVFVFVVFVFFDKYLFESKPAQEQKDSSNTHLMAFMAFIWRVLQPLMAAFFFITFMAFGAGPAAFMASASWLPAS